MEENERGLLFRSRPGLLVGAGKLAGIFSVIMSVVVISMEHYEHQPDVRGATCSVLLLWSLAGISFWQTRKINESLEIYGDFLIIRNLSSGKSRRINFSDISSVEVYINLIIFPRNSKPIKLSNSFVTVIDCLPDLVVDQNSRAIRDTPGTWIYSFRKIKKFLDAKLDSNSSNAYEGSKLRL